VETGYLIDFSRATIYNFVFMKIAISFLFFLLPYVFGASGDLYAIASLGTDIDVLEVATIKIAKNGSYQKIVTNFIYLTGFQTTYDGISMFDQDNDIIYYATDTDSAFAYSSDVKKNQLLPPISVGAQEIINMDHDALTKRIIFTIINGDKNMTSISYSTIGKGYSILSTALSRFNTASDFLGTLDATNQLYYLFIRTNSSFQIYTYPTSVINGPITLRGTFSCIPGGYLSYVTYDPIRKTIWGVESVYSPSLKYYLFNLDPVSVKCTPSLIQTSEFGIATAYTFNSKLGLMHIGWAPSGPGKIYTLDINTGKATGITLSDGISVTDLEVEI